MQCTISFLRDSCLSGDDGKRCKLVKMVSSEKKLDGQMRSPTGRKSVHERLVEKWQNPIFRFFFRSLSNHADSEDLTQKSFLRVYKACSRYQPHSKFSTWLFTIARNLLIDEIKRKKRFQATQMNEDYGQLESYASINRESEWKFFNGGGAWANAGKSSHCNFVTGSTRIELLEIAEIMGANEQMVKTWIYRARQKLKTEIIKLREKRLDGKG